MTAEFRQKQAELMAATVAKNDLVICTALVQGGKAPVLVTKAMVDAMKPGSVVVDLASDGGGNCEATKPGSAITTEKGVKILGYYNWPGRIPVASSTLYAKNLLTFLTTFWDKDAKAPKLPPEDDIVKGVMLTRGGAVVHKSFAAEPTAPAAQPAPAAASETAPLADPEPLATASPAGSAAPAEAAEPPAVPVTPEPTLSGSAPDPSAPAPAAKPAAAPKPKPAAPKAKVGGESAAKPSSTGKPKAAAAPPPPADAKPPETPPAPEAPTDNAP
jgi:hypothetical protein